MTTTIDRVRSAENADTARHPTDAPLWFAGLDGQFVVTDDHLWVAREGDLPVGAAPYAPRQVPLVEVVMFVIGGEVRTGARYVLPLLIGEPVVTPTEPGPLIVAMAASDLAALLDWAAREGLAVVDSEISCRVRPHSGSAGPPPLSAAVAAELGPTVKPAERIDDRAVGVDAAKTESRAYPVDGDSVPKSEPHPEATAEASASRTPTMLSAPTKKSRRAAKHDRKTANLPDPAPRNPQVDALIAEIIRPQIKSEAIPWSKAEVNQSIGYLIGRFGGIATARELRKYALDPKKWVSATTLREAVVAAIDARDPDIPSLEWHVVGGVSVAVGGSRPERDFSALHADLIAVLKRMNLAEAHFARRDHVDVLLQHSKLERARLTLLLQSVCAAHREAPEETQRVGIDTGNDPGCRTSSASNYVRKLGAPARFGTKARVHLDVEGFRTLAVVDLTDMSIEVHTGALKGTAFSDPVEAADAVVTRYGVTGTELPDKMACWLLDDESSLPLSEVARA